MLFRFHFFNQTVDLYYVLGKVLAQNYPYHNTTLKEQKDHQLWLWITQNEMALVIFQQEKSYGRNMKNIQFQVLMVKARSCLLHAEERQQKQCQKQNRYLRLIDY